jgi:hypothetical protein
LIVTVWRAAFHDWRKLDRFRDISCSLSTNGRKIAAATTIDDGVLQSAVWAFKDEMIVWARFKDML